MEMQRHKKLIVAAVLAGVLLFGSLGGVALAEEGDFEAKCGAFIDTVSTNYESITGVTLDRDALETAIDDARSEMREEGARSEMRGKAKGNRFQDLTDEQKAELEAWRDLKPRFE